MGAAFSFLDTLTTGMGTLGMLSVVYAYYIMVFVIRCSYCLTFYFRYDTMVLYLRSFIV